MKSIIKKLKEKKGESYIDTVVMVLIGMTVLALVVNVLPVFILKIELNSFANEIMREAEIEGGYNNRVKAIEEKYKANLGDVNIVWSTKNKVDLGEEIEVEVSKYYDIGFYSFGEFNIQVNGKAIGKSEVYWK